MVRIAIRVVGRISLPGGAVGDFVGGMREDRVPPIEEFIRVTLLSNRIVPCANASGYYAEISQHHQHHWFLILFMSCDARDPLDPPRTLIVTGNPLIAFCSTFCTLAPVPVCSLDLSSSNCPLRSAIASPGPKTGQNSNGAGSTIELLR